MLTNIKLIAFDGDDTLWYNEIVYNNAFDIAIKIANPNITDCYKINILYDFNKKLATNIKLIGYGYKTYIITLVSYLLDKFNISSSKINLIISKLALEFKKPVRLYPSVEQTITLLHNRYELIIITKGETFEQSQKIKSSNICSFFTNTFIVANKDEDTYTKILKQYNISPNDFLMVGNSFYNDIQPVINIGGSAIYIDNIINPHIESLPLEIELNNPNIIKINHFQDIIKFL